MEMAVRSALQPEAPEKDLLRFITCGSVDDGKSTLIGRLLHDTKLIFDDQLAALVKDSERHGTTDEDIDFALLLDGLEAEREQGITIDVAYRFFSTPRRSFIVADTPGHEQFTRNMATGASNAQLAVILIDARKGVLVQTRRHSFICSLLGIRHVVLAVNKIDLVDFNKETFDRIVEDYKSFAAELGFTSVVPIPISARFGDNVTKASDNTPGIAAHRFWIIWKRSTFKPTRSRRHSDFQSNWSTGPTRISAAMRELWRPVKSGEETRSSSPIRDFRLGSRTS